MILVMSKVMCMLFFSSFPNFSKSFLMALMHFYLLLPILTLLSSRVCKPRSSRFN